MKLLVAGYGLIGKQRVAALAGLPGVAEIVVTDPRLRGDETLGTNVRALDAAAAYGSRYDGAVVATPHDVAAELVPRIARIAPVLLLEKPLGRNAGEAQALAAAAASAACRLYVGFNYRFLKNVQHLARIVRSGAFGRVLAVDAVLAHGAAPGYESSWKTDRTQAGGGVCIDPGVHLFDLLSWLFGELAPVGGALQRSYWPIAVEDHASLSLTLPGGALANVFLSISSWQSRLEITVELEEAQLVLRGRGKFYGPQRLTQIAKWPWLQPEAPREQTWDYGSDDASFALETAEFVRSIVDPQTASPVATAAEAVAVMRVVDRCYELPFTGAESGA